MVPVRHAFRLAMAAWQLDHGLSTGRYDLTAIERQLSMTGYHPWRSEKKILNFFLTAVVLHPGH